MPDKFLDARHCESQAAFNLGRITLTTKVTSLLGILPDAHVLKVISTPAGGDVNYPQPCAEFQPPLPSLRKIPFTHNLY